MCIIFISLCFTFIFCVSSPYDRLCVVEFPCVRKFASVFPVNCISWNVCNTHASRTHSCHHHNLSSHMLPHLPLLWRGNLPSCLLTFLFPSGLAAGLSTSVFGGSGGGMVVTGWVHHCCLCLCHGLPASISLFFSYSPFLYWPIHTKEQGSHTQSTPCFSFMDSFTLISSPCLLFPLPIDMPLFLHFAFDISAVTLNLSSIPDLDARLTFEPCVSLGQVARAIVTFDCSPYSPYHCNFLHKHTHIHQPPTWFRMVWFGIRWQMGCVHAQEGPHSVPCNVLVRNTHTVSCQSWWLCHTLGSICSLVFTHGCTHNYMCVCFSQQLKVTTLRKFSFLTFILHLTRTHIVLCAPLQLIYDMPVYKQQWILPNQFSASWFILNLVVD